MKRILLLEDDETLCRGIALALKSDDIVTVQCHTKKAAEQQLLNETFDLAVFDVNLPDGNGLDLLRALRKTQSLPVIMLTANDTEIDIVSGLESGADDYITKPFSLAVLRARVNTQLRRGDDVHRQRYVRDSLELDFDSMEYRRDGQLLELSKTEQKLLRCLVENRGITLSREQLIDRVWTDGAEYVDENALSVTIKRLRDKLGDAPSGSGYIKTVYGIGYRWVTNDE